jgi:hypothetical protein
MLVGALLGACGGGGGGSIDQPAASFPESSNSTVAAPSLGDCFTWTPGTKYVKSDGYKTLIIQEQFEGQTAITDMDLRPNETRFGGAYLILDADFVTVLGTNDYDAAGVYEAKDVYTNFRLPVNMAPGQAINVNYSFTHTRVSPPSTTNGDNTTQYKFEGFESLTLGGRTFADVCKLRSTTAVVGETAVQWVAKGFGVIKQERQDANGATLPGTVRELVTIEVAP